MSTFRFRHYAECPSCGRQTDHDDSGTFISSFFLPDICDRCGEEYPEWKHVIEKQRKLPGWFKPWETINVEKFSC